MHKENLGGWKEFCRLIRLRFGHVETRIIEKYNGKDDPHEHLSHWILAWGEEPQPECVHILFHTLDVIPQQWYLETKLRHGTKCWYEMEKGFLLTYNFTDGWDCINDALQEVKERVF